MAANSLGFLIASYLCQTRHCRIFQPRISSKHRQKILQETFSLVEECRKGLELLGKQQAIFGSVGGELTTKEVPASACSVIPGISGASGGVPHKRVNGELAKMWAWLQVYFSLIQWEALEYKCTSESRTLSVHHSQGASRTSCVSQKRNFHGSRMIPRRVSCELVQLT